MNQRTQLAIAAICLLIPTLLIVVWISSAKARLAAASPKADAAQQVAVAEQTDASYCNGDLKKILRRVLESCGLLGGRGRGCQPLEARNVATVSGHDFNALFQPMRERGGIVQFEAGKAELDESDTALIDGIFTKQRGASYFFVVARASTDGPVTFNRDLSRKRADAVMTHLQTQFSDPDLEREVGLLWLGEEFAQLDTEFCNWTRSGATSGCNATDINRGAFIAWIDCRL